MNTILKALSVIIGAVTVISCNKTHDKSYTTGTFSGQFDIKKITLVDGVKTDESLSNEAGSVSMKNNDSMVFSFANSIYNVERTFRAQASNVYEYVVAVDKIVDRFEVRDNGQELKYYGTREFSVTGNDTVRFYEVNFNGKRD